MRILFVLAIACVLGCAVLTVMQGQETKVAMKRIPDHEAGIVCYVTNKGAISCVPEQGKRL
jgi:hypothetical protein